MAKVLKTKLGFRVEMQNGTTRLFYTYDGCKLRFKEGDSSAVLQFLEYNPNTDTMLFWDTEERVRLVVPVSHISEAFEVMRDNDRVVIK